MKYSDIIRAIDDIFSFFSHNGENLSREQKEKLIELQDLIHKMRIIGG